jgi:hypothetical protein
MLMDEDIALLPLCVATTLIVVPALLHRWEHAGVATALRPSQWVHGATSVVLSLLLAFVAALFVLSVGRGHLLSLGPLAVLLVLLFPWPITRYVLVPFGMWRAAHGLVQLCGFVFRGDVVGGQLVAGAMALGRRAWPDHGLDTLTRRADSLASFDATGIVAHALLAEVRGEVDRARAFMEVVQHFSDAAPPLAQKIAREWLVEDAIARADWDRAEVLGRAPGRRSNHARFLGAIAARRIAHPPVPSDFELVLRFLLAPRPGNFRHLLAALRIPDHNPHGPSRTPIPVHDEGSAFSLHLRASTRTPTLTELLLLGRAWDRALADSAIRSNLARRAIALRAGDPDRALRSFVEQVDHDLEAIARRAGIPLGALEETSASMRRVAGRLRHELLDELALATERLSDRVDRERSLSPRAELEEWLHVRSLYDRTWQVGGSELRRVAFTQLHDALCTQAVWLWNDRGEAPLASAMFRFLLDEAVVVGDDLAIELQRRNLACAR